MPCYNPFDDGSHEYAVNSVGIGKYAYIYYGQDLFGKVGLRNYTGKRVSGVFGLEGLDHLYAALDPWANRRTFAWESGLNNGLTRAQNQILQNHRDAYPKTVVTDEMQSDLEEYYDSPKYLRYILPQWTIVRILSEGGTLNANRNFLGADDATEIVTADAVQVIDYDSVNFDDLNVGDILTRVGATYSGGVPLLFIRCPVRSIAGLNQLDNAAIAAVRRCIKAHKQRLNYIKEGISAAAGLAAAREAIFGRDKINSEDYPRPWENYWGDGWFNIDYADGDQSDDDDAEYQPTDVWDHLDETRRLEVCGEEDICVQYKSADACNAHFKPIDPEKPDEINCMWCNSACRQYDENAMKHCSNLKNTAEEVFCGKKSGVFGIDLECDTTDADGCCSSDVNSDSVACNTGFDSNLEHCPIGTIDGRAYMYYDAKPPDNVGDNRFPGCNVRQCRNCKDFDGLTTIYCGEDSCTAGETDEDKNNLTSNCAGANDNDLMTCPCGFQHDDFKNYAGKSCDIRKCTKNKFTENRIYCGKDVCSADESVPSTNAIGSDDTYLIDCPYGYTHKGFQGSFGFNRRVCDKNH